MCVQRVRGACECGGEGAWGRMADHASGEASGSSGSSPQPSPTRITSAGRFTVAPAEDDGDNDGDGGVNDIVDEEVKVDAVSEEGPPVDPPVAEPSADDGNDQWPNPTPASESDANGNIDDEQAATDEVLSSFLCILFQ